MQNAASHVGDVRFLRDEFQCFHEPCASLRAAFDAETHHAAAAVRKIFLRQSAVRTVVKGGIFHPFDFGMIFQIQRHLFGIAAMAFHAQGERIRTDIGQKRVLRTHDRTRIAHHLRAAFGAERYGKIGVNQTVIAFVGRVEGGITGIVFEYKRTAVDDHSAERRRVPVHVFGRRVNDDIHAPFGGAAEGWRGKRVVYGKEYALFFTDCGNFIEIEHDDRGVGDRFRKDEFGVFIDERIDFFRAVVGVEKAAFDAEFGQRDCK